MKRRREATLRPDMKALGQRIDHWRKTRQKPGPMPGELWDAAVVLAGKYGVQATAVGLPVDFGSLKRRYDESAECGDRAIEARAMERSSTSSHEPSETWQFVEIDTSQVLEMPSSPQVSVELSAPDGATMRVRMAGGASIDVIALAGTFWKRGS